MPILYPAIDLKAGECVRLAKGDMARATVYNRDPADQARAFRDIGFTWLHVVDLDGAVSGESRNRDAVRAILAEVGSGMAVQLGGGIRSHAAIDVWLEAGVDRVVLGTAALRDSELVREAASRHPGRVAVGIDARAGRVAVEGWTETTEITAHDLARRFADVGVAALIHTDIDRDGVLAGINFEATIALAKAVLIPVIASGGLASMADIERLASPEAANLDGAITGRALYDGRIDARAALALLKDRVG